MNASIQTALKQLRLSGMAQSLEVRLQEAAGNSLTHGEFLELVLQDELLVRKDRQMQRRLKAAQFRELKTLEDFDWQFNPSIKKKLVYDLAGGRFVREARDCLWLGPPGTGKSHLCQAIGYQAIKMGFLVLYRSIFDVVRDFLEDEAFAGENKVLAKYLKPDLLIIDDMGIKQLAALFQWRYPSPSSQHANAVQQNPHRHTIIFVIIQDALADLRISGFHPGVIPFN